MKLEHSFTVPTGIEDAWKILLDIERIGPCMPGAAIESVDGDDFTGSVKVKLGPIGLTYKGKASFIEKDEAAHRAVIDARGRDARGNGTASAKVTATMTEQDAGTTLVKVDTDLDITGKPAQFGRGVMVDVGNKLIGQFADNLASTIGGEPAAAPAPARKRASRPRPTGAAAESAPATDAAPAADPAPATDPAEVAATVGGGAAIDEQAVTATADEPSGYSAPSTTTSGADSTAAPVAASSGVNGRHTATAPVRDVEPINLIESAGPAVAKRLAPPVVLALLILLFVWRRKRS